VVVWEVPAGRYPYLLMRRAVSPPERERFIILPFELERWQGHLLHAIAPESNGYWLALSPMHVQELQSADCPIRPLLELEDAT
jgi:hypothetical protein